MSDTGTVRTRLIRKNDRDVLANLVNRIPLFSPEEKEVAVELIDASILEAKDGYTTRVATRNNHILGFISFGDVPLAQDVFEIYWIGVDPDARRLGIGRKLVLACIRDLRKMEARLLLLETSSQERYGGTRMFYDSCGFAVESTLRDYYHVGNDRVVFGIRFN